MRWCLSVQRSAGQKELKQFLRRRDEDPLPRHSSSLDRGYRTCLSPGTGIRRWSGAPMDGFHQMTYPYDLRFAHQGLDNPPLIA